MLPFRVFSRRHPRRSPNFFSILTPTPRPLPPNSHGIISFTDPHLLTSVLSYRYKNLAGRGLPRRQARSLSVPHPPKSLCLNLFAHPHPLTPIASIFYKNMGSRGSPPRCPSSSSYRSPSSRDEKPVTVTLLESALTNRDTRKSFRMRFYENCRVSPAFCSFSALFSPGAFHNSFPFNGIYTPSKNSRVSEVPFRLRERRLPRPGRGALCGLCVSSYFWLRLSTFNFQLSTSPPSERALSFRCTPECATLEGYATRRSAHCVPGSGTYARSSPISRDRRTPQRGQVHALQPFDRHAPLDRHQ